MAVPPPINTPLPSSVPAPVGERRFPCVNCGGKLEFLPGTASLKCPYCGVQNTIPGADQTVEEKDYESAIAELQSVAEVVRHFSVKCDACGAEIDRPATAASFSCPFCGSNIVGTATAATHIKPWGVLPFVVTRVQAAAKFRTWIQSRWFAPNALKRDSRVDDTINGVYMPAWTFDSATTTQYVGERGDAYYVTVGSGKNRRTERRVRWSSASGIVSHAFDDVLVLASHSLPVEKVGALEPWDTDAVVPYADDYLAGFKAECYQVALPDGFVEAQGIMRQRIQQLIRADIGGDEQRIHHMAVEYRDITFKHLLLPVWISAYRYRDKVYRFLVNARTGEVQGDRPYSAVKITLAVLAGLLVVLVIVAIAAQNK